MWLPKKGSGEQLTQLALEHGSGGAPKSYLKAWLQSSGS